MMTIRTARMSPSSGRSRKTGRAADGEVELARALAELGGDVAGAAVDGFLELAGLGLGVGDVEEAGGGLVGVVVEDGAPFDGLGCREELDGQDAAHVRQDGAQFARGVR